MPITKLFFDDVREPPDDSWIIAKTVQEARDMLGAIAFDVVSLDHDIGYQMLCTNCYADVEAEYPNELDRTRELIRRVDIGCPHNESGTDLAKWMVDHLDHWPKLILLHSANAPGRIRMRNLLAPFAICMEIPYDMTIYKTIREIQE